MTLNRITRPNLKFQLRSFTRQNHDDTWHQVTMKADELNHMIKSWRCDLLEGSNATRSTFYGTLCWRQWASGFWCEKKACMITALGQRRIKAVKVKIQTPVSQWLTFKKVYSDLFLNSQGLWMGWQHSSRLVRKKLNERLVVYRKSIIMVINDSYEM